MRLSAQASTGIRRARGLTWVAVAVLCLGGCFASERTLARDVFVAAYGCPKNQVWVQGDGATTPLEATGCGHTTYYECHASLERHAIVCAPLQESAVSAASTAWSCPANRVSVEANPAPTPTPPPDVAADPERLAIWQRQLAAPPSALTFSASGCGQTAQVSCLYSIENGVSSGLPTSDVRWSCFTARTATSSGDTELSRPNAGIATDAEHLIAEAHNLVHAYAERMLVEKHSQFAHGGAVVEAVQPNSSAGKAGLEINDVILDIDHNVIGEDPVTANGRIEELMQRSAAASHLFHVRRGATTLDLTIDGPLRPVSPAPVSSSSGQPPSPAPMATAR
jgi:hypothetical protein